MKLRPVLSYVSRLGVAALAAAALPSLATAQEPSRAVPPQVEQQLQRMSAEEIRARIRAAGLTEEQVRQRLRDLGYSPELLDYYLSEDRPLTAQPLAEDELRRVLGALRVPEAARFDTLAVDTLLADSLVADSIITDTLTILLERADSLARILGRRERKAVDVFGMDLFARGRTQFQPVTMGPVPPNYRLGPGDELVLVLSGDVQEVYALDVTREGWTFIPNVGRVTVNGLTLDQFRDALYGYLGRVYSGVRRGSEATTHFDVSLGRLRRSQVFVIGEVARPGAYEVTSVATALHALYVAGGPRENGSFRNIQVRRGDQVVANLDLYEYLTQGSAKGDVPLQQGDVVFVPVREKRVSIEGNVVRPAVYELKAGEGLRDLLRIAGGLEPEAYVRSVRIERVLPPTQRRPGVSRTLVDVNAEDLVRGDTTRFVPLEAGDRVTVSAVPEERRNRVSIRGNIWNPGPYELGDRLTLWQLIEKAGGLRYDTYLGRAHIVRTNKTDLSQRVLPVSLATRPDGTRSEDPPLEEYDEVVVYSVPEFQDRRFVVVDGSVQNPGVYEFQEGMTLRDVVLQAGGFTDDAYALEAEVSRIVEQQGTGATETQVVRVPIDSTYVVTRARAEHFQEGLDGEAGAAPDFELARYDNVFIRRKPGWELQRNIVITGEVAFPGRYSLDSKDERLLSVIERAGGLTDQAYAAGIRFYRARDKAGRIGVNLPRVLRDQRHEDNLILFDGDSIHIPEYMPTVRIQGAVLSPTSALWESGAGLDHYIQQAGGFARNADKGRTRVEFANGEVKTVDRWLLFTSKPSPGPGSVVTVPAKLETEGTNWGAVLRDVVAITTAAATLIIAFNASN